MKSAPPIYTIYVAHILDDGSFKRDHGATRERTWGWFAELPVAEDFMLNNMTDIFECGYYNVGLIEEFPQGVLVATTRRWWFRGTFIVGPGNKTVVERMWEPYWAVGITNWAMG